jgi:hypothetical protein
MAAITVVLCLGAVLWPQAASAQSTKPYPVLFGQRARDAKPPQSIDFEMALNDGFDASTDGAGSASLNPATADGTYSSLDATLRYARVRGKRRLTLSASDSMRYQPQLRVLSSSYQASARFASPVRRRGHLDLSQDVAYSPYHQLELFPALNAAQPTQAPSSDYAITKQSTYTYTTGMGFTRDLGPRSALLLGYELRSVMVDAADSDLLTQSATVRLTRPASRRANVHVGVASRAGRYGGTADVNQIFTQEIDAGVEYTGRRVGLSASSGATFIPVNGGVSPRMIGSASLRAELSPRWLANIQYVRGLRFVGGFPEPFFADSLSVGISAQPSRRVNLATSVGYSTGEVGASAEGRPYGTYTGSAQLTIPLTRHHALYSEYVYYQYGFAERVFADALPPRLGRHSVRFGLKLWFPVLN